eukprot:386690_1
MGKVMSFLASVKSAREREKQGSVLRHIATNENIEWEDPTQKQTIAEGARAAQRLSVYQREPTDAKEREQYKKDVKTVDTAVKVLKKNYKKDNKQQIDKAMDQETQHDDTKTQQNEDSKTEEEVTNIAEDKNITTPTDPLEDIKEIETESDNDSVSDQWPNETETNTEDQQNEESTQDQIETETITEDQQN